MQGARLAKDPSRGEKEREMRFEDPEITCKKCGREVPRSGDPDPFATPAVRPKTAGDGWVAPVTHLRRSYLSCPWCAKEAMPDAPKKFRRARRGEKVEGQESLLEMGSIIIS